MKPLDLTEYGPYHTAHEIYELFDILAGKPPGGERLKLGETWHGRPLYAWRFGGGPDTPAVLYIGGCHAIEFIGVEQCAAVAARIVHERAELLEKVCVWFFPVMNPDGHYRVRDLIRRRRIPLVKTNARRVDLNRNFPVGFHAPHKGGIMAGSHRKIINYHGPRPISEPESQALEKLVGLAKPAAALALHSFGESLRFPPCHTTEKTPDHELLAAVAADMVSFQKSPYKVGAESEMYLTYGDISDWLYFDKDVLPFLLEIGSFGLKKAPPRSWFNIFMWTNPPDAHAEIENNTDACVRLAELVADGARKNTKKSM